MTADLFAMHSDNLRAVGAVLDRLFALARDAIRKQDAIAERELTLSAAFILGTKLEVRLGKLLREPGGFTPAECSEILGQRRQFDRWSLSIDIGFRRRYNKWYLDQDSIGQEAWSRHQTMQSALSEHLEPIIRMRNTLAHGQWVHPLNSKEDAKHHEMERLILGEALLSLSIKDRLAHHYCQLLGDLVSTNSAFERDFETTYAHFSETLKNLKASNIDAYRAELRAKHQRGLQRRGK